MSELIFLDADDGFHFLPSRAAAKSWMEAIDIEDGVYTVYDADGVRLDLAVNPNGFGVISVAADATRLQRAAYSEDDRLLQAGRGA